MSDKCSFVFSDELLKYKFSNHHPFDQFRLKLTVDLLEKMNALHSENVIPPRLASDEELALITT
jgi:acetoin utilization protein AcuC